jgi:hypothetical protein
MKHFQVLFVCLLIFALQQEISTKPSQVGVVDDFQKLVTPPFEEQTVTYEEEFTPDPNRTKLVTAPFEKPTVRYEEEFTPKPNIISENFGNEVTTTIIEEAANDKFEGCRCASYMNHWCHKLSKLLL